MKSEKCQIQARFTEITPKIKHIDPSVISLEFPAEMINEKDNELRYLYAAMQTRDMTSTAKILRDKRELISHKNQLGENLLHLAVKYNFEDLIDWLVITHGLDVDSVDHSNATPLHFAITHRNEAIARCLLKHNASTSAKNLYGKSPLHLAVNFGDLGAIELLLSSGADVRDSTSSSRQTSLHIALRNDDTAAFQLLMNNYTGKVDDLADVYGETLLHYSTRQQRDVESSSKLLIDRGADVNFANDDGETPLHFAAHRRNVAACKLFLESAAADVDAKNKHDETPLHLAVRYRDYRLVELLLSFDADVRRSARSGDTMLHVAVDYYEPRVFDLLLRSREIEMDAKNAHGLTAFHTAIKARRMDAAEQLLRRGGVDVNTVAFANFVVRKVESLNYTPLHTAIGQKDLGACEFLLDNGAALASDRDVFLAVEFGCARIVELLVRRGANANARDSLGRSVLYAAMKTRDRDKVEALLRFGADKRSVNETDDGKESALHLAVRAKDEKFARFLLGLGVDVNLRDGNDMTALALADGNIANHIVASVALIKFNGLPVCKRNESVIQSNREFALYYAGCVDELERIRGARYGHVSLIEFLRNEPRFWGKCVRRGAFEATIDENFCPIYWERLKDNVDQGVKRWRLIRRVRDNLRGLRCFQRLYDVLDDVVDNFSDDELRRSIRNFNEQ